MNNGEELHRVFVGGLFESITKDELSDRFKSFGDVTDVTIVQKKDGEDNVSKTFGYVNLMATTQKLNRCFALFGGTKWKGHQLKVQLAKEDFMARLERERNEPVTEKKSKKKNVGPQKTYDDILEVTSTMKKSVPGTPVEGEKNWVVSKYGRPLPVMYIPKFGNRKVVKVDPSKFCHCLKRIPDSGNYDSPDVDGLTWSLDKENDFKCKKKKRKRRDSGEIDNKCGSEVSSQTVKSVANNEENVDINVVNSLKKKKKKAEKEPNIEESMDINLVNSLKKRKDEKEPNIIESVDINIVKSLKKKKKREKEAEENIFDSTVDIIDNSGDTREHKKKKHVKKNVVDTGLSKSIKHDLVQSADSMSPLKNKPPKLSVDSDAIDNCVLKSIEDDETENCDSEKTLSSSIIQQLLLGKKSQTRLIDESQNGTNDNGVVAGDKDKKQLKMKSKEMIDDGENLFDFEFKDIGGKKQTFLDSLIGNFELREGENEIERYSDGVSSDFENSNESSNDKDDGEVKLGDGTANNVPSKKYKDVNTNIVDTTEEVTIKKQNRIKIPGGNKQQKHALSEEQRKKALEVRDSQLIKNKDLISKALKAVDKSDISTSNRIVFNDSDGDDESASNCREDGEKKSALWSDASDEDVAELVNDKDAAKSNLLFEASGDEENEEDDEEFKVKPQFQGKCGEKLFKLQQTFRGDERFRLDERFADDDEEEGDNAAIAEANTNGDIDDANNVITSDADLQKEKEMNISVLEKVLGKSLNTGRKESERTYQRYDPENIDHEKFEVKALKSTEQEEKVKRVEEKVDVPNVPEVSKEKFYSVNESLKDLFGKTESSSFSFLGQFNQADITSEQKGLGEVIVEEERDNEEMEIDSEEKSIERIPSWKKGLEKVTAEVGLETDKSLTGLDLNVEKRKCTYLYFSDEDDRLEIGRSFVRSTEIDEITNQWKAMRRSLTEDYKKKHKDAVRRIRKIRERRFFNR